MDALPLTPDPAPSAGPAPAETVALAFATDPDTEAALREGLSGHRDSQVWPGDLRAAMAVLALPEAPSPDLLFVDLDGTPYPGGAIHELAAVCEVGTVVIALGQDGTARFSREILLAGVSDYLVKPITAAGVREAAGRATAPETPAGGRVAGLVGAGGSGATTLAAMTALLAAERGRYVSVLDLSRTFPALPFQLDVEPAAGLDQLLDTAGATEPDPEMVDGVRAARADRIAVYAYRWSPAPPPRPPLAAVGRLLAELKRRSHLVLVDGLEDPGLGAGVLAEVDTRVLVVEPTVGGAARAARTLERLGPAVLWWGRMAQDRAAPPPERGGRRDPRLVLVRNHTRAFPRGAGARALRNAGLDAPPDVVVPFEPSLPEIADRGWPNDRLPRRLREPLDALMDRILAPHEDETEAARPAPERGAADTAPRPRPALGLRSLFTSRLRSA